MARSLLKERGAIRIPGPFREQGRVKTTTKGSRGYDMELFRGLLSVFVLYLIAGTILVLGILASKAAGDPLLLTGPALQSPAIESAPMSPPSTSM